MKETMEENIIDTIKENEDRYRIHVNYQFEIEVDEGEYYAVRRKSLYPKTYEECCDILNIETNRTIEYDDCLGYRDITQYDVNLLTQLKCFHQLRICRDAYWKIAGEQMGLDEPWKPDWSTEDEIKYVIEVYRNNVRKNSQYYSNTIFAFPTAEMRDVFYENFKKLIEQCKEFL
jgi:hypothetical protein